MTSLPFRLSDVLRDVRGVRMVAKPFDAAQELGWIPREDTALEEFVDSDVVETGPFEAREIAQSGVSSFEWFEDGTEKTRLAFFEDFYPGCIACVGAAILKREGREMLHTHGYVDQKTFVAAFEGTQAATRLRERGYEFAQVRANLASGESPSKAIQNRISVERDAKERRIIAKWLEDRNPGWLLVDGGIANILEGKSEFHRIVGVVKSHRKMYFQEREKLEVIQSLRPGQRSPVFLANPLQRRAAYSWYLRLRHSDTQGPFFGLIRVELPPAEESMRYVDDVSSWILAERAPLSLPDVRFDRMIYPIRRVEMYLRSLQPSDAQLTGMVGT
ncbi:MAG: hypothetical protein AKCLJLPJ_00255 [Fimbriimonadales bacterium]|nr:hypothetical protein [Fimbriimonadales bacterium]